MKAAKSTNPKKKFRTSQFHPRTTKAIISNRFDNAWRNNKNIHVLVCIDVFRQKADMEPMKDKECATC